MYLFNITACTTHFSVMLRNRSGLKATVEELFPTSEKSGVILQVIHTASKTISVSQQQPLMINYEKCQIL